MSDVKERKPVTHEEIAERLDRGDKRFDAVDARLEAIERSGEDRLAKLEAMASETTHTRELIEVMMMAKTAGRWAVGFLRLVKWAGGVAAAIAAFFILAREYGQFFNPKG